MSDPILLPMKIIAAKRRWLDAEARAFIAEDTGRARIGGGARERAAAQKAEAELDRAIMSEIGK